MTLGTSTIRISKFGTCVIGSGESIRSRDVSSRVNYQTELAVVISLSAMNVSAGEAMDYVFGYTNFNDVSARDFQFADGQWQRGKSCDTFSPMVPAIVTANEVSDPHNLNIKFRLNGHILQDSNTG